MIESALFLHKKPDIEKLTAFGFTQKGEQYDYTTDMAGGQLQCTVTVLKSGTVTAKVIDTMTGEPYILHQIPTATGAFVGKVKTEYETILQTIASQCFVPHVFQSAQATAIIQYASQKYHCQLEYLWAKFPGNAVLRRQDNAKWYAAMLKLPKQKLGVSGAGQMEIIDLRADPQQIMAMVDRKKFFPGYHMNKTHWFTICLDGSVPTEEICSFLDNSYTIAAKK